MLFRPGLLGRLPCPQGWYYPSGPPTIANDFTQGVPAPFAFTRASVATDSTWQDSPNQQTYNDLATNAPIVNQWGTKLEPATTNFFLNSNAPVTQSITTNAGSNLCIWMVGSGTLTITAGTGVFTNLGTVTNGAWRVISCTTTGTFQVAVAGTVYRVQVEGQPAPTSYILSGATPVTRAETRLIANFFGGQLNRLNGTYWIEILRDGSRNGERLMTSGGGSFTQDNETDQLLCLANQAAATFRVFTPGVTIAGSVNASPGTGSPTYQSVERIAASYSPQGISLCANYTPVVASSLAARPSQLLSITLGGGGSGNIVMNGYIRGFRYWNTTMSDAELHECTGPGYYAGTPVFDLDGTQLNQWRMWTNNRVGSATTITDATFDQPAGTPYNTYTVSQIRSTSRGLMTDPNKTNYFLNSLNFTGSGTVAGLPAGQGYMVWLRGTGSITITAGTAVFAPTGPLVATQGNPVYLMISTAGSVNYAATGTIELAQFESVGGQPLYAGLTNGPSAYIRTLGSVVQRGQELIALPVGPWYSLNELVIYMEFFMFAGSNGSVMFTIDDAAISSATSGANRDVVSLTVVGNVNGVIAGNTIVANVGQGMTVLPIQPGNITPMVWHKVAFGLSMSRPARSIAMDGVSWTVPYVVARFTSQSRIFVGPTSMLIRRFRYYDYSMSDTALVALTT